MVGIERLVVVRRVVTVTIRFVSGSCRTTSCSSRFVGLSD